MSTSDDTSAVEWFAVEADLNPGNRRFTLRITERKDRWVIEESAPLKTSRASISVSAAAVLRARVNALRISQGDIESLAAQRFAARGPNGEELVILAPFDGVYYRFTIRSAAGVRSIAVSNPESNLHFEGHSEEAERLRELMRFFRDMSRIARGEKAANKAPEPTPGPVTSRADWVPEMILSRKARLAPGPVVAHL